MLSAHKLCYELWFHRFYVHLELFGEQIISSTCVSKARFAASIPRCCYALLFMATNKSVKFSFYPTAKVNLAQCVRPLVKCSIRMHRLHDAFYHIVTYCGITTQSHIYTHEASASTWHPRIDSAERTNGYNHFRTRQKQSNLQTRARCKKQLSRLANGNFNRQWKVAATLFTDVCAGSN